MNAEEFCCEEEQQQNLSILATICRIYFLEWIALLLIDQNVLVLWIQISQKWEDVEAVSIDNFQKFGAKSKSIKNIGMTNRDMQMLAIFHRIRADIGWGHQYEKSVFPTIATCLLFKMFILGIYLGVNLNTIDLICRPFNKPTISNKIWM